MRHPKYGSKPSADRLDLIKQSPNFKNGKFQNIHFTPNLTEGNSLLGVTYNYFFKKSKRRKPVDPISSVKTNLSEIPAEQDVLVWFGHSSYYMQVDGKRMLVDPVFSGNASPIRGSNKAFQGSDIYSVDDIPDIDYLFITHDHYDHLDYETVIALRTKVGKVICGLGVGAHLESWGYIPTDIIEEDWNRRVDLGDGFIVNTAPARHFSGRSLVRNNTLWVSFLLQTPSLKIYLGGDSGYDTHFAEIGKEFGPIDLAILENGQYDPAWKYIHMLPEEVIKAGIDLRAKRIMPVHSAKFAMANHDWDDPLRRVTEYNKQFHIPLVTPKIGELVYLKNPDQQFQQWWLDLR